jgi:hypothetical protein
MSAAVCLLVASSVAKAEEFGHPIDLSSFSSEASDTANMAAAEDLLPVSLSDEAASSRFYVTGIVGASFATLTSGGAFESIPGSVFSPTGSVNDALFTGGGAVGMAFATSSGQLRM